jgi:fructose-1,6-bisphosphatase I
MQEFVTLERRLEESARANPDLAAVCDVVAALAKAGSEICSIVSLGVLGGGNGATERPIAEGEAKEGFRLRSRDIIVKALRGAPVASIASDGLSGWALLNPTHTLAVAFDPLDGSSNIEANLSAGTIFSILPAKGANNPFIGRRAAQIAAGFFVYGLQTNFVLTLGDGVDVYTFDRRDQQWRLTQARATIPHGALDYAINGSNYQHWEEPIRAYIDECLNGTDGPRGSNFNIRWIGTLVTEALRILTRGGVYLCPADRRAAHSEGRLRLIYEAHPVAFIMEQAGGQASTGRARVLDIAASNLNQRVPMIFGCSEKVAFIDRLYSAPAAPAEVSPLFGRRGLFRA